MNIYEEAKAWLHGDIDRDAHDLVRRLVAAQQPASPPEVLCDRIETDKAYNRFYIPLPGGWEVQTKGKGSTFRICDRNGDRLAIPDSPYLHDTLERMARDINAASRLNQK